MKMKMKIRKMIAILAKNEWLCKWHFVYLLGSRLELDAIDNENNNKWCFLGILGHAGYALQKLDNIHLSCIDMVSASSFLLDHIRLEIRIGKTNLDRSFRIGNAN
jgi:hypothetical protein